MIIKTSDIAKCPYTILSARHYRPDGRCHCVAPLPQPLATKYQFLPPGALEAEPEDIEEALLDAITVTWRGRGLWSISRGDAWQPKRVWNEAEKGWDYETGDSTREPGVTRFDLETALEIGRRLADETS